MSAPALAAGRTDDVAATQAYLRASESYARRAYAEAAASAAAIEARASEIATECPLCLTYAPRDTAFEVLGEVADLTAVYADVAPVRSATLRLAHAIAHLSWSSRRSHGSCAPRPSRNARSRRSRPCVRRHRRLEGERVRDTAAERDEVPSNFGHDRNGRRDIRRIAWSGHRASAQALRESERETDL